LAKRNRLATQPTKTRLKPEEKSACQTIACVSPELFNDPKFMKTSAGRMMLAQALSATTSTTASKS
jgi:hypothetical protein